MIRRFRIASVNTSALLTPRARVTSSLLAPQAQADPNGARSGLRQVLLSLGRMVTPNTASSRRESQTRPAQPTALAQTASTSSRATATLGTTATPAKRISTIALDKTAPITARALTASTSSCATAMLGSSARPAPPTSTSAPVKTAQTTAPAQMASPSTLAIAPTHGPAPTASCATEQTRSSRKTRPQPATV